MPPLNLYARVRFYVHFAHETAGAARTRLSLRPLLFEGVNRRSSATAPRQGGRMPSRCLTIESETRATNSASSLRTH